MTNGKKAYNKLMTVACVCDAAKDVFVVLAQMQKKENEPMLKDEFMKNLYNMSLKEIAHLLESTAKLPKKAKDILN